MKEDDVNIV